MSHLLDHEPAHLERPDGHGADHHEHDNEAHAHGLAERLRHTVSELFGGHSHDAADQIDDALEADSAGRRALIISLVGLGVTAVIQAVVAVLSGSIALLGDTLHIIADALTAIPLLVAFALARRTATGATPMATGVRRILPVSPSS